MVLKNHSGERGFQEMVREGRATRDWFLRTLRDLDLSHWIKSGIFEDELGFTCERGGR